MDVRDWPMDQIMQLPDCCFGRRFPVSVMVVSLALGRFYDISEVAFPERCVLWELSISASMAVDNSFEIRLALGDQLPTTAAMMDALEPLVHGWGIQGRDPRLILLRNNSVVDLHRLRMPIQASGRRLVIEASVLPDTRIVAQVIAIVSSIPTEVPDCLLSGYLRSQ